jgi:GMP synthase-like glutamine amidotransferase
VRVLAGHENSPRDLVTHDEDRSRAGGPRVLLLEHERDAPAGLVNDWLVGHDADVQLVRIGEGGGHDAPPEYDLIVSLGSERSALDDHVPWVGRELELLRAAVAADVPVLGICFGGQLLARALGGEVRRAPLPEIGWLPIHSDSPGLISAGPWLQWHFDIFSRPPGAVQLAHSRVGPQAFTYGRSLGVQFHPEIDVEIVSTWASGSRAELDQHGVDAHQLLEETRRRLGTARAAGLALFEAFYERVARLSG